jgi:hypothetical protein
MVPIAIVGVAANIDVGAWNADYDFRMGLREYSNGHGPKLRIPVILNAHSIRS